MNLTFLQQGHTGRLIIIFAGWSTDAGFYRHISLQGWDILVADGYSDLEFPSSLLDEYHTVALFAWSLGVYVASRVIPFERISLAVAVNGTEQPVSDDYGIPQAIYRATADSLNERNLMKFQRRMCGKDYENVVANLAEKPEIERLRGELQFIFDDLVSTPSVNSPSSPRFSHWHRCYISRNDMIFPIESQKRAWENHQSKPEMVILDSPHYVDLKNIILSALPSFENVGKLFHKALPTYEGQATAQKAIARRLVDFPGGTPSPVKKVLETGPGSGIFTRLFVDRFHPEEMDFVELYPVPPFRSVPVERYFTENAEDFLAREAELNPAQYDAIVSASAVQWFVNQDAFFKNVSKLLKPGGFLLCSSFLPGNLKEMSEINPFGLIYRSIDEIEHIVNKYFQFAKLEEEKLIVNFKSPRDTLLHLKETGVGGGINSNRSIREILTAAPVYLTYRPLYIYAVKYNNTLESQNKNPI